MQKAFNQLDKLDLYKHPFVVVFTNSNETKEDLLKGIAEYNFNKRMIKVINNTIKEEAKVFKIIYQQLLQLFSYYNQLGDRLFHSEDDEESQRRSNAQKINFLVCGRPGLVRALSSMNFWKTKVFRRRADVLYRFNRRILS